MPKLRCKCPGCQTVLQFEAERTHALRMTCPQCQRAFTVPAAPSAQAAGQTSAAGWPPQDNGLDDFIAQLPPMQPGTSQPAGGTQRSFGHGEVGYAQNYAAPRSRKKLSAKAKKQVIAAVGITAGVLVMLSVGLFVAIPLLSQADIAELIKSPGNATSGLLSFDSREAVLRDLESECRRLEAIGRAIPEGDQSKTAAQPLLDGRPALVALLRRACRLSSVRGELADWTPDANGVVAPPPATAVTPSADAWFWQVKLGNSHDEAVTEAINQLTVLRGSIFTMATIGILELPSPLDAKAEQFDWTDEDRRMLATLHLRGRFQRDFARALAALEPDTVTADALKPLHTVIDQYAKAARELAQTSRQLAEKDGKAGSRMFVQVPKGTPYQLQERSSAAGLISLKNELKHWKEDPQFQFVLEESKTLNEDIEDIMFGSSPRAIFTSPQSSLERYAVVAAERQAEVAREAELAAKQAREAEEKLRLAEERRRQEEAKRQQASSEQVAASGSPPATPGDTVESAPPSPGGFPGPAGMGWPRGLRIPRMAAGDDTSSSSAASSPPLAGRGFIGGPGSGSLPPSSSMPPPTIAPADSQSMIIIKIRSQKNFDSNRIVKMLAEKTGAKSYHSSQSNNEATMRFSDKGELKRFVDAIDFGTVESVDEQSRTISVTIP